MVKAITAICAALALGMSLTATAAAPTSSSQSRATPQRYTTMAQVRSQFGKPASKDPAVGNPPISRWHYPSFIVYFEYNRVVDTVVPGDPAPLYHTSQLTHGQTASTSGK